VLSDMALCMKVWYSFANECKDIRYNNTRQIKLLPICPLYHENVIKRYVPHKLTIYTIINILLKTVPSFWGDHVMLW
jgi:hypothetical protein